MNQNASFYQGHFLPEQAGERLDKALALTLPSLSRSRLKNLLDQGHVQVNGVTITNASMRVKSGDAYAVQVPAPEDATPAPQAIPLHIVYEDDALLVIDKPADLVVHPGAGNADQTLVNALLHHCGESLSGIGGVRRPGIVHRLDKDTSGLMVVAKTDAAHQALSAQFNDRTISRTYQALVWGVPSPTQGRIETQIGRHPVDRKKMAVVKKGGRNAITLYRVVKAFGTALSLVECTLMTGRTHQIRVHLTSIGHPLVGDPVYGRTRLQVLKTWPEELRKRVVNFPRQALHAVSLKFIHPITGEALQFNSPLPEDMEKLLKSIHPENIEFAARLW